MKYILVGSHGKPSMKGVFELMQSDTILIVKKGSNFYKYTKNSAKGEVLRKFPELTKEDVLVRWGNNIDIGKVNAITYNTGAGVSLSSNKKESRLMLQSAGIPVPRSWGTIEDFNNDGGKNAPFIVRPHKHKQGNNLVLATAEEQVEDAVMEFGNEYYISEFYPKTREFRVHVAHGKVLIMQEKPAPEDKNTIAWNLHVNHDAFTTIKWADYDIDIARLAIRTVARLGLDYGAVDVLAFPSNKKLTKAVVCEVNTAPTLKDYTRSKYAAYFDWLMRPEGKREHWNTSEFKEGSSYAWKNFQLADKKQ